MLNSVNNPTDALAKANIDTNFIKTLRGYVNNPIYGFLLPIIGLNKKTALEKLDSIENALNGKVNSIESKPTSSSVPTTGMSQGDDLDKFKRGLKSFK